MRGLADFCHLPPFIPCLSRKYWSRSPTSCTDRLGTTQSRNRIWIVHTSPVVCRLPDCLLLATGFAHDETTSVRGVCGGAARNEPRKMRILHLVKLRGHTGHSTKTTDNMGGTRMTYNYRFSDENSSDPSGYVRRIARAVPRLRQVPTLESAVRLDILWSFLTSR